MIAIAAAVPAPAQERDDRGGALEEFSQDTERALRKLLEALRPGIEELLDRIDDLSQYEAPEILPNGDIIIRRKRDAPPLSPDDPIEL